MQVIVMCFLDVILVKRLGTYLDRGDETPVRPFKRGNLGMIVPSATANSFTVHYGSKTPVCRPSGC